MKNASTNFVFAILNTLIYFIWALEFTFINICVVFVVSYVTVASISFIPSIAKEI